MRMKYWLLFNLVTLVMGCFSDYCLNYWLVCWANAMQTWPYSGLIVFFVSYQHFGVVSHEKDVPLTLDLPLIFYLFHPLKQEQFSIILQMKKSQKEFNAYCMFTVSKHKSASLSRKYEMWQNGNALMGQDCRLFY